MVGEGIDRDFQNDLRPWPVHTGLFCFLLLFFLLNGKNFILSQRKGGNYECQYLSEEVGYGDGPGCPFRGGMDGLYDHC